MRGRWGCSVAIDTGSQTAARNPALRTRLRSIVSPKARRRLVEARHSVREASSRWRSLPDFLIIGTQRGGTSSLFRYLSKHPQVSRPLRKETEYFAGRYDRGASWYRAHFPFESLKRVRRRLTFEATPDYMLDPRAARRASQQVPNARIVALLRDPVERAVSHYHHMVRLGFESLDFPDAIAAEDNRCAEGWSQLLDDSITRSTDVLRFSYRRRGLYADQLDRWISQFGRDNVLVVISENFFAAPADELLEIERFVGLDPWSPGRFPNYSLTGKAEDGVDPRVIASLTEYFRPHNDRLRELLSSDPGWGY